MGKTFIVHCYTNIEKTMSKIWREREKERQRV